MTVGNAGNVPRWAATGAGQGDEDLSANDQEVPDVVPVDTHTLVPRDGGRLGPLIT